MAGGHAPAVASSSPTATFMNLVKPFVGAGILALPHAFKTGGLVASAILMLLMAGMANYCIRLLLQCLSELTQTDPLDPILSPLVDSSKIAVRHPAIDEDGSVPINASDAVSASELVEMHDGGEAASDHHAPAPTFREIGSAAYGSVGRYAVDVNLVLSQLGFCTAYMAFVGENMSAVLPQLSYNEWIIIMMITLSVFCQLRSVSSISFTSAAGNFIYLACIIIIFIDGFRNQCCLDGRDIDWINMKGLPQVFGTACFALEGIGLILPVKAAMHRQHQHRFFFLLNTAVAIVAAAYVIFGSLGYLFYGSNINATITFNLTQGAMADSVKVSLSLSLYFSFILQMFPVVDISDYAVYYAMSSRDSALPTPLNRKMILVQSLMRIFCVCLTGIVAITVSNFGLLVSLTGSLANSMIAFILPTLFYLRIIQFRYHPHPFESWQSIKGFILPTIVVVLGICASIVGVYSALDEYVESK